MNRLLLLPLLLLETACFSLTITPSKSRVATPWSTKLSNDVIVTSSGPVDIKLFGDPSEFVPASLRIEFRGKVLYVDPLEVPEPKPADVIFITHMHGDHLSLPDIKRLAKAETVIVAPKMALEDLQGYNVRVVRPGDSFEIAGVKVETVAAYNLSNVFLWMEAHPKDHENVGYVIEVEGTRLFHPGDTEFVPEHRALKGVTVAFLPIGGENLTMDVAQAADAVDVLRPEVTIPMHYEVKAQEDVERFRELVSSKTRVETMWPPPP